MMLDLSDGGEKRISLKAGTATRLVDEGELRQHHSLSDCWLAVDGSVYDLTDFVEQHPGAELLGLQAGEDATAMVLSNHPFDVERILRSRRIGTLIAQTRTMPVKTPFLSELQLLANTKMRDSVRARGHAYHGVLGVLPTLIAWAICWIGCYVFSWWPLAILMGFCSCSLVGSFAHEHAHGLFIAPRRNKRWLKCALSTLWAVLFPTMLERHFQLEHFRHHEAPMDPERDYELVAVAPYLRLTPAQPWRALHTFQHRTAPAVYAVYIILQFIHGFTGPYFDTRQLSKERAFIFENYVAPLLSLAVHVILPLCIARCSTWLVSFLLFMATWQATTYFVAAVPHMTRLPPASAESWPEWVCRTTCNVSVGPVFRWLAGGFDFQIEHHLLPFVPRTQLPSIAPIVRNACAQIGYPYLSYATLRDYFDDHYSVLATLRKEGANP